MREGPRDYDREWTTRTGPNARLRVGYTHDGGQVTRFVVQLEYDLGSEWTEVVRADHDGTGETGHDVSEAGIHLDVYRGGDKLRTERIFPPTLPGRAFTIAEAHLTQHAKRYIDRFEEWHGMNRGSR